MQDTTSAANLRMVALVFEEKVYDTTFIGIIMKRASCNAIARQDEEKV